MNEFTGKATVYDKARPGYAPAALDFMAESTPPLSLASPAGAAGGDIPPHAGGQGRAVIADVGAGTGKFSVMLAARGYDVIAVEPNADMRSKLPALPNLRVVDGAAEATGLPGHSVDAVTCAQAFHWFNGEKFKQECTRILRPGGRIFALYNSPDPRGTRETHDELIWYRKGDDRPGAGWHEREERLRDFFGGDMQRRVFSNPIQYDAESWLAYMLSHSVSPRPGDEEYGHFVESVRAIYERHNVDGKMLLPLETVVYTSL